MSKDIWDGAAGGDSRITTDLGFQPVVAREVEGLTAYYQTSTSCAVSPDMWYESVFETRWSAQGSLICLGENV